MAPLFVSGAGDGNEASIFSTRRFRSFGEVVGVVDVVDCLDVEALAAGAFDGCFGGWHNRCCSAI
jgi:hypothetical protein